MFGSHLSISGSMVNALREAEALVGRLLGVVEEEIFRFLRKAFKLNSPAKVRQAFQLLHDKLIQMEQNPFERRSFLYLDVTAWLESKILGETVEAVMQRKSARSK